MSSKGRKSIQSVQTQGTRTSSRCYQPPSLTRQSDLNFQSDSRASLASNFLDAHVFNVQTCTSEIGYLMVISSKYDEEGIFVTCGSSMAEKSIKLWDVDTLKCLFEMPKRGFSHVVSMVYCAFSQTFVTVTKDRTLAAYQFSCDPVKMDIKFSCRLTISPSHIQCYKEKIFIGSVDKQLIQIMNKKTKKIIKNIYITSQIIKFSYIPQLASIATTENGCSLIRLTDSSIQDVYYTTVARCKSPYRNKHYSKSCQEGRREDCIQEDKVKFVSPILIKNNIGTDGEEELCLMAIYENSLKCVIFVFSDFILFYDVQQLKICCVIKDLMHIENVQYSAASELLIVQCTENRNNDTSFYLIFKKDSHLNSEGNIMLSSSLKFNKISCEKLQKSRFLCQVDSYLIMDSSQKELKSSVIRRKIALPSKMGIKMNTPLRSSRKTSRNGRNSNLKGVGFALNTEYLGSDQNQNVNMLEIVEEESNNQPIVENQEKMCKCAIF